MLDRDQGLEPRPTPSEGGILPLDESRIEGRTSYTIHKYASEACLWRGATSLPLSQRRGERSHHRSAPNRPCNQLHLSLIQCYSSALGRDDTIRTCNLSVPNAALYQIEPHPVVLELPPTVYVSSFFASNVRWASTIVSNVDFK